MSERGLVMAGHSLIIGIIIYAICIIMNINQKTSENTSIAIASAALLYMIVFGHNLPGSVNISVI